MGGGGECVCLRRKSTHIVAHNRADVDAHKVANCTTNNFKAHKPVRCALGNPNFSAYSGPHDV